MAYRPMTLAGLAGHLSRQPDEKIRWKHVWEFLEEYRWEPADKQAQLLLHDPGPRRRLTNPQQPEIRHGEEPPTTKQRTEDPEPPGAPGGSHDRGGDRPVP